MGRFLDDVKLYLGSQWIIRYDPFQFCHELYLCFSVLGTTFDSEIEPNCNISLRPQSSAETTESFKFSVWITL